MNVRKLEAGNFSSEIEGIVVEGDHDTLVGSLRGRCLCIDKTLRAVDDMAVGGPIWKGRLQSESQSS